jgi:hypothetical protein
MGIEGQAQGIAHLVDAVNGHLPPRKKGGPVTIWESFFSFKKTPFSDSPMPNNCLPPRPGTKSKARLEFLANHHGAGLLTGEVGDAKSTAARAFTATLNPSLYKILYVHFCAGSALDLLRQVALELNLEPLRGRGDLGRQIAEAVVRLNLSKKQR